MEDHSRVTWQLDWLPCNSSDMTFIGKQTQNGGRKQRGDIDWKYVATDFVCHREEYK